MYYMDLLCYEHDCSVNDSTGAHEWEDGAREEAEKEMKDIKAVMKTMAEEGIQIEEIIDEINIRV